MLLKKPIIADEPIEIFVNDTAVKLNIIVSLSNKLILKSKPNRRQAITWTNADLIHCHIYAALGGDELTEGMGIRSYHV